MNGERAFTLAVAACCLFALGTSAAMLNSSVSTTPDDVINVDYASLPLPSDQAERLKRQFKGGAPHGSQQVERPPDAPATGDNTDKRARHDDTGHPQSMGPDRSGPVEDATNGGEGQTQGTTHVPKPPSLLDRLLALLRALFELLLAALPWLAALLALALAVAFRDRIADRLRPYLDRVRPDHGAQSDGDDRLAPAPSNDVARAWVEMVDRLGLDRDRSLTPGECARRAVEAGVDRDAVSQITRPFREVRYGGRPVTERRTEQARTGLRRFREQYRGEGRP